MSNGALPRTSDDSDFAISNQPEVSVPIAQPVFQPPSEGTDPMVSGVADGTELVGGHVRTEAALSGHVILLPTSWLRWPLLLGV